MRVTVRRGSIADAPAAAELWLRARRASAGTIPPSVHSDDEVRTWFAAHVAVNTDLWLAEHDRLVGLLVLNGPWIDQLYVEPTGRGIGSQLIDVAKRERPEGLTLWTFVSNTGAQRFYERHGFVERRRTDGAGNEERAPDILYAWP